MRIALWTYLLTATAAMTALHVWLFVTVPHGVPFTVP